MSDDQCPLWFSLLFMLFQPFIEIYPEILDFYPEIWRLYPEKRKIYPEIVGSQNIYPDKIYLYREIFHFTQMFLLLPRPQLRIPRDITLTLFLYPEDFSVTQTKTLNTQKHHANLISLPRGFFRYPDHSFEYPETSRFTQINDFFVYLDSPLEMSVKLRSNHLGWRLTAHMFN